MKKAYRPRVVHTISISVGVVAVVYAFIGILFFLLLNTSPSTEYSQV